jgi:DNA-binding winged helix-turn-helix (wHTH) protein
VSNLRRKLRDVMGTAEYIQTIRGKGYRFTA